MDFIFRCIMMYVFLLVVFRIAGKRALAQITTFDIVLLLIISETTQQALVGNDHSFTNAFGLIATFIALEILLTKLTLHWPAIDRWLNSRPLIIVRHGRVLEDRMRDARVNVDEVLTAARATQGLANLKQIEHAVLECNGEISIIPVSKGDA
jgi:uncharacterized membrane protein YcaP (DUF421 family)